MVFRWSFGWDLEIGLIWKVFKQVRTEGGSLAGFVEVLHVIRKEYQPDIIITQYCQKINVSWKAFQKRG
jgi:hypothetical protein